MSVSWSVTPSGKSIDVCVSVSLSVTHKAKSMRYVQSVMPTAKKHDVCMSVSLSVTARGTHQSAEHGRVLAEARLCQQSHNSAHVALDVEAPPLQPLALGCRLGAWQVKSKNRNIDVKVHLNQSIR